MSKRNRLIFGIDIVMAVGFALSALSGLVMFVVPGGFEGGRNPYYGVSVLALSQATWNDLHVWSSLAMSACVLAHLVLHWKWIACMLRNAITPRRRAAEVACAVAPDAAVAGQ